MTIATFVSKQTVEEEEEDDDDDVVDDEANAINFHV